MTMDRQSEFTIYFDELVLGDCDNKCLTSCPLPRGMYDTDCMWTDPAFDMFDKVEYSEFFWWREYRDIEQEPPASLKPTDYRCPRCYSTNISIGYPYIQCLHCGYNEPLIDFPENVGRGNQGGGNESVKFDTADGLGYLSRQGRGE